MNTPRILDESSPSVHAHLEILQAVIQRMAANSSSSKAWCIALVSAILVVVANDDVPAYAWLALIPTILFLVLDTYYLALEKSFRDSYNAFIDKLHSCQVTPNDLYAVTPTGNIWRQFFKSLRSFSVWPFYFTLIVMTCLAAIIII